MNVSPLTLALVDIAVLTTEPESRVSLRRDLLADVISALVAAELAHRACIAAWSGGERDRPVIAMIEAVEQLGHALDLSGMRSGQALLAAEEFGAEPAPDPATPEPSSTLQVAEHPAARGTDCTSTERPDHD